MKLIPAIDVLDGRCVRLYQGRYDRVTDYGADPVALARAYADAGADALHLVDLGAARDGARRDWRLLERVCAAVALPVQTGGGMRSDRDLSRAFRAGAARAVVGTRAAERPLEVSEWLARFGAERVCLALDVRRLDADARPMIATRGWREDSGISMWTLLEQHFADVRHVLCTGISRDGTLGGVDGALYAEAVRRHPCVQWQASGGVGTPADLRAAARTGVAACIVGRALLDRRFSIREARSCLQGA